MNLIKYLLLVILLNILFFGGIVSISDGNSAWGIFLIISSIIILVVWRKIVVLRKEERAFLDWIQENGQLLLSRPNIPPICKETPITLDSTLTRFHLCISLGVITFTIPTPLMLKNTTQCSFMGYIFTIGSLVLGWWGLPFGPIFTIRSLYINLCGGDKITIYELLNYPIIYDDEENNVFNKEEAVM